MWFHSSIQNMYRTVLCFPLLSPPLHSSSLLCPPHLFSLLSSLISSSLLFSSLPFSHPLVHIFLFSASPVIWENVAIPKSQVTMRSYITNVGLIIGRSSALSLFYLDNAESLHVTLHPITLIDFISDISPLIYTT